MALKLRHRLVALPFIFATAAACSLVLPPDEGDDDVQRCKNSEECRDVDDNRLVAACFFDDDQPAGAEGVCIAEYFALNCDPTAYPDTEANPQTFGPAYDDVDAQAYLGDCETLGQRGCRATDTGGCDAGLTVVQLEVDGSTLSFCDDPDATLKAMPGAIALQGVDVQSQFCRWYFNDPNFVCNKTGLSAGARCQLCDPALPPDAGGCYETWLNGELSPVYTDCPGSDCNDGTKSVSNAVFGPAAEPVPTP